MGKEEDGDFENHKRQTKESTLTFVSVSRPPFGSTRVAFLDDRPFKGFQARLYRQTLRF